MISIRCDLWLSAPRQVHGLQRGLGHTAAELNGAIVRKPWTTPTTPWLPAGLDSLDLDWTWTESRYIKIKLDIQVNQIESNWIELNQIDSVLMLMLDRNISLSMSTVSVHVTTWSSIERCEQAFCTHVSGGQEENSEAFVQMFNLEVSKCALRWDLVKIDEWNQDVQICSVCLLRCGSALLRSPCEHGWLLATEISCSFKWCLPNWEKLRETVQMMLQGLLRKEKK